MFWLVILGIFILSLGSAVLMCFSLVIDAVEGDNLKAGLVFLLAIVLIVIGCYLGLTGLTTVEVVS